MLSDLVSCGHTIVTKQVNERESSFWEFTKLPQSIQISRARKPRPLHSLFYSPSFLHLPHCPHSLSQRCTQAGRPVKARGLPVCVGDWILEHWHAKNTLHVSVHITVYDCVCVLYGLKNSIIPPLCLIIRKILNTSNSVELSRGKFITIKSLYFW